MKKIILIGFGTQQIQGLLSGLGLEPKVQLIILEPKEGGDTHSPIGYGVPPFMDGPVVYLGDLFEEPILEDLLVENLPRLEEQLELCTKNFFEEEERKPVYFNMTKFPLRNKTFSCRIPGCLRLMHANFINEINEEPSEKEDEEDKHNS